MFANRTLFNLTSSDTIARQDGIVIDIPGGNVNSVLIFYSPNVPVSYNQQWIFENVNQNAYLIRSKMASDYAIAIGKDGKSLLLKLADKNSLEQIWYIE